MGGTSGPTNHLVEGVNRVNHFTQTHMAIFGSCHQTTGPGTEITDSGKTTTSMLRCSNLSWLSELKDGSNDGKRTSATATVGKANM